MFLLYKKRSAQDRTASEWNHGMLLFMGKSLETGPWMGLAGQREEWQDMIRKFLQCTTIRERIEMLTNTVLQDWSDQDLGIILSAFNLNPEDYAGKEDKIAAIEKYLADYKHSVEQKDTMDCEQMDNTTFLESDKTLYSEKGIINLVHNVLRNN